MARAFCSFSRPESWLRMCGGWVRADGSAPSTSISRCRSAVSRSAAAAVDSSSAIDARSAAAPIASPTPWIRPARLITSRRRMRAPSSRASRRARPTWLWAARAAYMAIGISTPSRRWSSSATASAGGVRRRTWRDRERIVMTTSSSEGAQRIQTVRGTGSSIALSRASAARSVRRSASSTMMTRHGPTEGRSADIGSQLAGLLDLDRQPLGGDDVDVGVGAVDRGAALAALAAAAAGDTPARRRRRGPPRSGRTRADR